MGAKALSYPQNPFPGDLELSAHERALLSPVLHWGRNMFLFIAMLGAIILLGIYAYSVQLRNGLAVTGMRDTVSWGVYITDFVFFIGISHVGALLSSILRLTKAGWRHPITRMAEAITFSALLMGALMPFVDLGHPERALNLIRYGRLQSPILWDLLSITTYLVGSTVFLYLPMLPDLALLRDKPVGIPAWRRKLYQVLSLGWHGTSDQFERLEQSMNTMAVLILPIAVMVHTVVSWIFAMTLRPGWNSSIFGPYFVAGALASGAASVVLAMAVFRKLYHLENYITERHFKNMSAILLVLVLVYLYFNLAEYVTPAFKMELGEKGLLQDLFTGSFSLIFWSTQVFGLLIPAFLLVLPSIKLISGLRQVKVLRPAPLGAATVLIAAVTYLWLLPRSHSAGIDFTSSLWISRAVLAAVTVLFLLSFFSHLQAHPVGSAALAATLVVIQAWVKRYLIVIPVLEHPFMPASSSLSISLYKPTWVELSITAAGIAGFILVYYTFSRLFPIVSVWETNHER